MIWIHFQEGSNLFRLKLPVIALATLASFSSIQAFAQGPPAGGNRQAPAAPRARPNAFPTDRPPADAATVGRGKALYGVHCNFCHGSDARGGEGGPNLLRTEILLKDMKGELLLPVVQNGKGEMPPFNLNEIQVADIAGFLHNFPVAGYDLSRNTPLSILVGDANAGKAYFAKTCAKCHSTSGDLKGLGAKFSDPKQLQQYWLMPGGGRGGFGGGPAAPSRLKPVTVAVTTGLGVVEGRLIRIDDFLVVLAQADGSQRTFTRNGDAPKVVVNEPLKPHKELLRVYSDDDIHNVTSYLSGVK